MSDYVIAPPPQPAVPVAGGGSFPVRRIYCIGRNYAAHAREMGGDPTRETPFFFLKPADALQYCAPGETVRHAYPAATESYHHEIEMVVALKSGGRDIPEAQALDCVYGYAVGLDMTRRDRQNEMKAKGWPWEIGKSADFSAPIGPIHPVAQVGHRAKGFIRVSVDGAMKQQADLADMIWSVPEQIAILSRHYELKAGDLIYSGTPEGVGAVKRGQTMVGAIEGLGEITLAVA